MFKIYMGMSVAAAFALTGCLSTQYASGYEETYEPVNTRTEAPARTRPIAASARVMPARFESLRCPAGTTPHIPTGTCMMDQPSTVLPASSVTTASTPRPQNLILANTTSAPRAQQTTRRHYGGANYRVRTGDTVYSLARARCLSVATLQAVNGLDATYKIYAGDGLHLPLSQC